MNQEIFFYREDGILKRIDLDQIRVVEAAGNYIRMYSFTSTFIVRIPLDDAISQLPKSLFIRIHRSILVSLKHIETIGKDYVTVVASPKDIFPVSKTYYPALMEKIRIIEAGVGNGEGGEKK